ncbi:hypothetical protein P170DRAFT_512639 [Aspergillus steynii IBT 23096]|uniref:DUF7702 domain-containing protein n=1 Tax=Aspergillus steynii IBT 23096 TaxID=1392250 RepID=A0A2I2FZJ7_9EURO|nr:uncharacterized protein P170DRAFT_512639 [Aspergillus steynii IBT 23096]PLB46048.1 hypothetical protein P170DRAFT_512639 [Aspergillus steynii IBT 23096]
MAIISSDKRHIAIAEVVIFSMIQIFQFYTRFIQEWRYWHHDKRKSLPRCIMYSWMGLLGVLAQLRIAGSAMVISNANPGKSLLITEYVLQGIGLSPLMFEVSLVLLRSGQAGRTGPGDSRYPKQIRFALHLFRFPIFISIVLVVVGASINKRVCTVIGSIILVIAFAFGCGLAVSLAIQYRAILPKAGHHCVLLVLTALPFLVVRVANFLLAEFGPRKYSSEVGDVGVTVGMGLLMEIFITVCLLAARAVAEPFWSVPVQTEEV